MNPFAFSHGWIPLSIAAFCFAAMPFGVLAGGKVTPSSGQGNPLSSIGLPKPAISRGSSLADALAKRKSCRSFSEKPIGLQTLSDLLWATAGENREDGKRTAPSAYGAKSVELLVALDQGVYSYRPRENRLVPVVPGDHRRSTGMQAFVETAPVNLLFVADMGKLPVVSESQRLFLLGADAGAMSQNASLYCASKGLGTVVRAGLDGPRLGKLLGLPDMKRVVLAQTVGWPVE